MPLAVQVPEETLPGPAEGKGSRRRRHADVDADITGFHLVAKLACRRAALSKQAGHVSVPAAVDESDGVPDGVHVKEGQDGPENFRLQNFSLRALVIEQSGPEEVSPFIPFDPRVPTNHQDPGSLTRAFGDQLLDPPFAVGCDDRPHLDAVLKAVAYLARRCRGCQGIGKTLTCLTHGDRERCGQAALTGAAQGGIRANSGGHLRIGIGKHNDRILRATLTLHSFPIGGGACVNVARNGRRAHEADGADAEVIQNRLCRFLAPVHEIQDPFGEADFFHQLKEFLHRVRDLLGGLHKVGVAAGDGIRKKPEGDHSGEIERGNDGADADGLANPVSADKISQQVGSQDCLPLYAGDGKFRHVSARRLHNPVNALDDGRILGRNVGFFAKVGLQIVELNLRSGADPHSFPIPHADGLLKAAFEKFSVEVFVLGLFSLPENRRRHGDSVDAFGCGCPGQLGHRRQDIPEGPDLIAHLAGFDSSPASGRSSARECRLHKDRA